MSTTFWQSQNEIGFPKHQLVIQKFWTLICQLSIILKLQMRENKCSNFIVNRETTLGAHQNYVHIKIDTNYFSLKKSLLVQKNITYFKPKLHFLPGYTQLVLIQEMRLVYSLVYHMQSAIQHLNETTDKSLPYMVSTLTFRFLNKNDSN